MDIAKLTREELAQYILTIAEDSVIAKFKKILTDESEQIVAYTTSGKALSVREYQAEIRKGLDDIKEGRVTSDDDLAKEILTW